MSDVFAHMQSQDWHFQHPFYQHHATEQIPSSTMRFTYLNFQQELLRETSPLLVQVLLRTSQILCSIKYPQEKSLPPLHPVSCCPTTATTV